MLRVYYSNRTEELLDALVERVRLVRDSLYDPIHIVVPNRNMRTYLELSLARLDGICANVQFRLMHELFRRPGLTDRVLGALFDDDVLGHEELEPIRTYLEAGGRDRRAVDQRRVQLARELARIFAAYADTRPELIEGWRAGLFALEPELRSVEQWQRRLWLALGDGDVDLQAEIDAKLPPVLQVFGVSYLPRTHIDLLGRVASDVYFYTLNPCQEIWEAISTPVPMRAPVIPSPRRYERRGKDLGPGEMFSVDDPFRLVNAGEMLPLRLWGRVGREHLRLTNALTGCELVPRIKGPEPTSLLEQLQRDIALRKPDRTSIPEEFHFEDDESITVLESANVRRELESIAAEIWRLVRQSEPAQSDAKPDATSEPLRFNEVALILPPAVARRYQALVGSVFGQMHALPHNIVDLPVRDESRIVEAIELLLEIPPSRFARKDVLQFVTHPSVIGAFSNGSNGSSDAYHDVLEWCEALGIVRGLDRKDQDGTYIHKDVFNWDQGLKRLALGAFMSGERSGDERLFEQGAQGDDTYLVEEIAEDELETAGRFGLFVRSLLGDARDAARVHMTVSAWMDFMSAFIATYVKPSSSADENVLARCLRAISAIADAGLGGRKIGYHAARELVATELRALSGSRGQYLVDGVVVSSFLPMRTIPFKVVFIAGLGEGHFPAPEARGYLDMRRAHRRAGDVSPRDEDTYLFLETLLCTRERLYLSYVARDELTGEPLQPSSLVLELIETLEQGFVNQVPRRVFPLRRFEDEATRASSPPAAREAVARELGSSLQNHLDRSSLAGVSTRSLPSRVQGILGCTAPPPAGGDSASIAQIETLSIAALRRFLECPLQGWARFALRLTESEPRDHLAREDESFRAEPLESAGLLRESFRRGGEPEVYDELAHRLELRGVRPTGVFGSTERERHFAILASWREALDAIAGEEATLAAREPASCLVGGVRLELASSPLLFCSSPRLSIRLCSQSRGRFDPRRESLHGFLDHVLQSAAGRVVGEPYALAVINAGPSGSAKALTERFTFAPIPRERAVRYLETLLEDMRGGVHDYLLPCEVALSDLEPRPPAATSSRFGPIPHPEDYDPPEASRARAIVSRRFGLYFESLGETQ